MRKNITYECEICNQKYATEKEALDCESLGKFQPSLYPPGLMYEYHHHRFVGIFAIPAKVKASPGGYKKGHIGETSFWACRAKEYRGDSLGKELCGHTYLSSDKESFDNWIEYHHITKEKLKCPEFKRMVDFLKKEGITPSYYTPEKKLVVVN